MPLQCEEVKPRALSKGDQAGLNIAAERAQDRRSDPRDSDGERLQTPVNVGEAAPFATL